LEENKNEDGVVVASGKTDPISSVKKAVEAAGIEMPDLVATGDLTVENKEIIVVGSDKSTTPAKLNKKINKKEIPLPAMGKIFMFEGHEYKVIYINKGQHRFSCEPHKGVY